MLAQTAPTPPTATDRRCPHCGSTPPPGECCPCPHEAPHRAGVTVTVNASPTAGPWCVGTWNGTVHGRTTHTGVHHAVLRESDGLLLAPCGLDAEGYANASLMAAAPRLAEACLALLAGEPALQLARAALDAARIQYPDRAGVPADTELLEPTAPEEGYLSYNRWPGMEGALRLDCRPALIVLQSGQSFHCYVDPEPAYVYWVADFAPADDSGDGPIAAHARAGARVDSVPADQATHGLTPWHEIAHLVFIAPTPAD